MNASRARTARERDFPQSGAPWSLGTAALCLGIAASSCSREIRAAEGDLIERLAFVPAARAELSSSLEVANSEALLVAQYEVTRAEWRAWYAAQGTAADVGARARIEAWESGTDDWPASFMTLDEARGFARASGMRLPTGEEWLRVACGTFAAPYPWGLTDAASVSNTLELGLRAPTPVGTFEQGRTPFATYDMLGNVWEWVDEPLRQEEDFAWAMGGSFLSQKARLFDPRGDENGTLHLALDPRHRAIDVGVRLCVEARAWLEAKAGELGQLSEGQSRLAAVGRRWGGAAVPLLEELARAHPREPALAWLLAGARP